MRYTIFGKLGTAENRLIVRGVGCTKDITRIDCPWVELQVVEDHPEAHWVKWSLRHRRTIEDCAALKSPWAAKFKNPRRLLEMLDEPELRDLCAKQNAEFLAYHARNTWILRDMVESALGEKRAGRSVYAVDKILSDVRWGEQSTHKTDQFKINAHYSPWFARLIQMECAELIGFFRLRTSTADSLTLPDGRKWEEFAAEHEDQLQFSFIADRDEEESDWEYL
jgi:hypothetical protein